MRGLDPRISMRPRRSMDCRVKPGNDEPRSRDSIGAEHALAAEQTCVLAFVFDAGEIGAKRGAAEVVERGR